jgi:hypothetical protein
MISLALNQDNILRIENFNLVLVSGSDQVAQSVRTKLKTFRGEWFADEQFGLPWFSNNDSRLTILGKNSNIAIATGIIRREILGVEGVDEILEFNSEITGRTININCLIRAGEDEILIEETI